MLTSENGRYHALVRVYATSTSYIYEIAFSTGVNDLQVDQVDRENDKRASTYTQLVPSKFVAVCNASVICLIIRATPTQLLR